MDGVVLGVQIFIGLAIAPLVIILGFYILRGAFYLIVALIVLLFELYEKINNKVNLESKLDISKPTSRADFLKQLVILFVIFIFVLIIVAALDKKY